MGGSLGFPQNSGHPNNPQPSSPPVPGRVRVSAGIHGVQFLVLAAAWRGGQGGQHSPALGYGNPWNAGSPRNPGGPPPTFLALGVRRQLLAPVEAALPRRLLLLVAPLGGFLRLWGGTQGLGRGRGPKCPLRVLGTPPRLTRVPLEPLGGFGDDGVGVVGGQPRHQVSLHVPVVGQPAAGTSRGLGGP